MITRIENYNIYKETDHEQNVSKVAESKNSNSYLSWNFTQKQTLTNSERGFVDESSVIFSVRMTHQEILDFLPQN